MKGFESMGAVISVCTAVFVLAFTSRLFGCLFTIIAKGEPEMNWLIHYDPAIAETEDLPRYVTAFLVSLLTSLPLFLSLR
jgi:hypothetical protein